MGLWEVTEEVLSQAAHAQNEESMPSYAHISYRALKDIPKEYTNPYNCKVRALAFNNNHKVSWDILLMFSDGGGPLLGGGGLGSPPLSNEPSSVVITSPSSPHPSGISRSWVLCPWTAISTSGKLKTTCAR